MNIQLSFIVGKALRYFLHHSEPHTTLLPETRLIPYLNKLRAACDLKGRHEADNVCAFEIDVFYYLPAFPVHFPVHVVGIDFDLKIRIIYIFSVNKFKFLYKIIPNCLRKPFFPWAEIMTRAKRESEDPINPPSPPFSKVGQDTLLTVIGERQINRMFSLNSGLGSVSIRSIKKRFKPLRLFKLFERLERLFIYPISISCPSANTPVTRC